MPEEAQELTFGQRVRLLRERTGKSRTVFGGLIGKSMDWVKAIENDVLQMPKLPILLAMAEVLGVKDLRELTGMRSIPVASLTSASHPAADQVADAMRRVSLTRDVDPATLGVPGRVASAWKLWHSSSAQKTAIAPLLPDLLADARAVVRVLEGEARRRAYADLAQVYHLVDLWMAYQPTADMVWLSADRGMVSALESDNPTAIAAAGWFAAHDHRIAGGTDAAEQIVGDCLALLDPRAGGEQLAAFGALNLTLALTYSQVGRDGVAWRHWDIASDAVNALGPNYVHPWLNFSRFTVDWFGVTIDTDLFRAGVAIRRSEALDPADMSSRTRRAVYLMDVARAHLQRREYETVVRVLGRAHRESSETVRYRPFARHTILELTERRGRVRDEARRLATAVGLLN